MLIALSILLFVVLYTLAAVYAERKVSAFIQDRLGPMETGKFGWLQTLADILKMIQKENIVPSAADRRLFLIAPVIIFVSVYMGFAAIPIAPSLIGTSSNMGVFYILAIISIEVVGFLMVGWGSNNKYALYGATRSVAQIVSYEIPAGIAIISAVMLSQSLNMNEISVNQGILSNETIKFFGIWDITHIGGFLAWNIFQAPHLLIAFAVYFIAALAESNRAPFDVPEAESELIAGFHIEYTGIRFALVFLAEYGMMLLVSMVAVVLFLGGWNTLLPNIGSLQLAIWTTGTFWGVFWIISKSLFLVLIQMWIRWTLPRFRVDQLMGFCWKVLTPLAFACLFISGIWRLLVM
ncbi:complex I subunit 1/NuoH family protein [Solitalea koreensis]|uniref:NADH-quinone oxidoreductase subunit H n=1 Tax=Solitalea koreensis TaxID=543615 RepID=A0A521D0V3_9SPHI|nr:complex I subunit 1 family protein [Solitalea koreensis]SMO65292.1 NADH dehydrogenase subunit H [Solitalea koreensis]